MDESILQRVLEQHSHLDLTPYVSIQDKIEAGGGPYRDVFCSHFELDWQPTTRAERTFTQLLGQTHDTPMGTSSPPIKVAVKVIRLLGRPDAKIEKVCQSLC